MYGQVPPFCRRQTRELGTLASETATGTALPKKTPSTKRSSHRREPSTFAKCLAVHMHFAARHSVLD